jgi:putative heme iron utilization protein
VSVVDENANVLITGQQNGIGPNYSLVNSRFIVSTWADEQARREEARTEQERVQERIAQQRRDREAADAARAEARAVWDSEFPAVRDAFAAIGLTVPQGIDGIHLSPESAKAVAAFILANATKEVAA